LTLRGNITTDQVAGTGDVTFSRIPVILLGADVTISSDADLDGVSGLIDLGGSGPTATVDGQQGLTLVSGDGDGTTGVVLAGSFGRPLKYLTIQRTSAIGRTLLMGTIYTDDIAGSGDVKVIGSAAPVVLGGNVSINTDARGSGTGGDVDFGPSTIDALAAG